jgi:polyferredoxin/uncharacterized protein with FMN-binding domain
MRQIQVRFLKIRWFYQSFFLLLVIAATINHHLLKAGKGLSYLSDVYLHYVCPVCGVTTIYQFFSSSTSLISKIQSSVFWIIGGALLSAMVLGSVFCGWICPFGGYQDIISRIGKKIFKNKHNNFLDSEVDKYLRWFRYIVLAWVIYMSAKSAITVLESLNPYHSLLNLFVGEFAAEGLFILGIITISSLFIQRPWCKYFCPYGALLGISNSIRFISIRRNPETCINCKRCDKACPMNITVSENKVIRDVQCISCMECTSNNSCPIKNTVMLNQIKKEDEDMNEKVKTIGIASIVLAVMIGTAYGTSHKSNVEALKNNLQTNDQSRAQINPPTNFPYESGQRQFGPARKGHHSEHIREQRTIDGINISDGKYKDGIYTAEGVGYAPSLKVKVTIKDNKIIDVQIVSHNETPGFYERAFEVVPNEIIESQSTNVDTVSGATMSSYGIIEAVNKALTEAAE